MFYVYLFLPPSPSYLFLSLFIYYSLLPPLLSFSLCLLIPLQETDAGVHESLPIWAMDELTRNSQMILQMLHFGAYQEILGVDGAKPIG